MEYLILSSLFFDFVQPNSFTARAMGVMTSHQTCAKAKKWQTKLMESYANNAKRFTKFLIKTTTSKPTFKFARLKLSLMFMLMSANVTREPVESKIPDTMFRVIIL